MTKKIQHIVASYDIHDPKRLQKVAKAMKDYGERVLKSVFECNLTDDQFLKMKNRVDAIIEHTEDSVRYYFVCDKCVANVDFSGSGSAFIEEQELVIT
ncbi:MAG: CRISPR-associated endonuclease Cas2 [Deltaproteobacteria bacterium]|nr:CRISPR-associated endonuclease Cas2 [Deltaproteobacteria bacterium]MBW2308313.1 CRISPR-associated endonuclease Cas2 [Deltaproteobacteria bacterium]